jgi:Fur family peroxide stress response transcriptional regulator
MDVDAIDIGKEAYEQTGYMITKVQLTAYGICPNCQEKLRAAGEPFMAYREEK